MTSKYGMQLYGKDLYSSANTPLEANLSLPIVFSARLTESEPLQANLSVTPVLSARIARSKPVEGGFSIPFTYYSYLRETSGLRSNLSVVPDLHGVLFRAGEREFVGDLRIEPLLVAGLALQIPLVAHPLEFTIVIEGGHDIYIGDFWKPDEPESGDWIPDGPVSGPWTPI